MGRFAILLSLVLFKDEEMATEILKSHDPKQQKALGRRVRNFDQEMWEKNCKEIVRQGNVAKVYIFLSEKMSVPIFLVFPE